METRTRLLNSTKFVAAALCFVHTLVAILGVSLTPVSSLALAALGAGCGWWRWPGQWSAALRALVGGVAVVWTLVALSNLAAFSVSVSALLAAMAGGAACTVRIHVEPSVVIARHVDGRRSRSAQAVGS